MYLVQLLLPLADHAGQRFPRHLYDGIRRELTDRFGGVTAYSRSPAEGAWVDEDGAVARDDIIVVEVMCPKLERAWWKACRERLAQVFGQDEIVARAIVIEAL
jgi:hypothetical protein